jgi:hypothetical protein
LELNIYAIGSSRLRWTNIRRDGNGKCGVCEKHMLRFDSDAGITGRYRVVEVAWQILSVFQTFLLAIPRRSRRAIAYTELEKSPAQNL